MTTPLKPWERKGYTFSIDWPPGFEPQPYEPPVTRPGSDNLMRGRDTLNKLTGRKYYGKKATHDYLQGKKA